MIELDKIMDNEKIKPWSSVVEFNKLEFLQLTGNVPENVKLFNKKCPLKLQRQQKDQKRYK